MLLKNRFGPLFILLAVLVVVSALVRTVLLLKALPNIDLSILLFAEIYAVGFFYDCVTFFYLAIPIAFYLTFIPDRIVHGRCHRAFVYSGLFALITALVFDGVAEYLFFDEFGTRFNFIAIDYLVYTREVLGNINESYPLTAIFGGVLVLSLLVFMSLRKYVGFSFESRSSFLQRARMGLVFAVLPVLAFVFVNLSYTAISQISYANELAGNGLYDLVAAFRNSELDFNKFYLTEDEGRALATLRRELREKNNHFMKNDIHDITRVITNQGEEKRLNVIVLVEESLSAEYLGVFGNQKGITPNLDRLSRGSLFFTRFYATGTRTVRGLEALTLSIPPLPGMSLVKRPGNDGLFSWGSVMRKKGYDTKFIYGGYGYFDNMNYFFSHNGFDIIDRNDFGRDEITFSNIWGVCDEDLFKKVIREAGLSYSKGKPFFSMVMTTSNHRPFTYPAGKIDIPAGAGRDGGVKYADYAIGEFIKAASGQPWFRDTVIVIVADHCAGSAGKTELPVKRYEIPLLIYSPAHVRPGRIDRVASQIDVAPTVLGLLSFSYTTRFMGSDILKMEHADERAFLSTYQKLGFLKDDTLLVIGPQKYFRSYSVDLKTGIVKERVPRQEDADAMLGYYQGASYLYTNRLDRMN
jgi:phosphoglycerol transferase MdoB-like AlkP superfamily enzyme